MIRKKAFLWATAAGGIQPFSVCTATIKAMPRHQPDSLWPFVLGGRGDELYKLLVCRGGFKQFDLRKRFWQMQLFEGKAIAIC